MFRFSSSKLGRTDFFSVIAVNGGRIPYLSYLYFLISNCLAMEFHGLFNYFMHWYQLCGELIVFFFFENKKKGKKITNDWSAPV